MINKQFLSNSKVDIIFSTSHPLRKISNVKITVFRLKFSKHPWLIFLIKVATIFHISLVIAWLIGYHYVRPSKTEGELNFPIIVIVSHKIARVSSVKKIETLWCFELCIVDVEWRLEENRIHAGDQLSSQSYFQFK